MAQSRGHALRIFPWQWRQVPFIVMSFTSPLDECGLAALLPIANSLGREAGALLEPTTSTDR